MNRCYYCQSGDKHDSKRHTYILRSHVDNTGIRTFWKRNSGISKPVRITVCHEVWDGMECDHTPTNCRERAKQDGYVKEPHNE